MSTSAPLASPHRPHALLIQKTLEFLLIILSARMATSKKVASLYPRVLNPCLVAEPWVAGAAKKKKKPPPKNKKKKKKVDGNDSDSSDSEEDDLPAIFDTKAAAGAAPLARSRASCWLSHNGKVHNCAQLHGHLCSHCNTHGADEDVRHLSRFSFSLFLFFLPLLSAPL